MSNLSVHWALSGHQTTFVTYKDALQPYFPIEGRVIYVDALGRACNNSSGHIDWSRRSRVYLYYIKMFVGLFLYVLRSRRQYDAILANYCLTAFPVYLGSLGRRAFYYVQAFEPDFFKNFLAKIVAEISYRLPLVKIANANVLKNYRGKLRCKFVIPPGVDASVYFAKLKTQVHMPLRIGTIVRSESWKGTADVSRAVELLQEQIHVEYVAAFGNPRVRNSRVVHPDTDSLLADFYRYIDILIATPRIDLGGIHYPVIEAMTCGTPVITTGYYPADMSNSYIVPVHAPEKIVEMVLKIASDPEGAAYKVERAKAAAREFSWTIVSTRFIEVFQDSSRIACRSALRRQPNEKLVQD